MATDKTTTTPPPATDDQVPADDLRGVLVLATGTLVRVPAEGAQVSTHHFDPELGATVPVRDSFLLSD